MLLHLLQWCFLGVKVNDINRLNRSNPCCYGLLHLATVRHHRKEPSMTNDRTHRDLRPDLSRMPVSHDERRGYCHQR